MLEIREASLGLGDGCVFMEMAPISNFNIIDKLYNLITPLKENFREFEKLNVLELIKSYKFKV